MTVPTSADAARNAAAGTGLFVGGAWRDASDGATFDVHDPADGSVWATPAAATTADCLDAVQAAADAFPTWSATPPRDRSELLRRAFETMRAERDLFAEAIVRENGKSWADAVAEAGYAAEFFRWFAEEAVRVGGDYRLAPSGDKQIVVTHQPIGVALLITPWNFPAAMATRKIAPALAAGCSVVLKPASETPVTAALVVDLLRRVGVPDGVVNLATPTDVGPAVAAMLADDRVTKLSFTGSTEVGRLLLRAAADRVVDCSMELGGNAPFAVLAGADVDAAVEAAMVAKMRNGGAACTAANRFYIHDDVYDAFAERFTARMADQVMGAGLDPANTVGALVSPAERDKVGSLVDGARHRGAKPLTGGETPGGVGAFYPPTVLAEVAADDPITTTEIFGPVAPLIRFGDADDVAGLCNKTSQGLIGYVYGPVEQAMRLAHQIDAGMVAVNRGIASDPAAPFGGMKQSGLGREGGKEGIDEFLETKYIAADPW